MRSRTASRLPPAVAALLLVALAATALPACAIGGGGGSYTISAFFQRAVSVFPSSDVKVLGLPAGTVKKVEIVGDQVRIDMSIRNDIPVPADVTAQIVPQSLIGERYIQLAPAFKEGMERAEPGHRISQEHTITPVEPDEALAAVKKFLDSLDPDGLGRLVRNLDDDLQGNGATLNDTLGSLSELVSTFAQKDNQLGRIVDSFDRLTQTLATRERQLGQVIEAFATASQVLADERRSIEGLVGGLAQVSRNGLVLVREHSAELRSDIQTLTDAAAVIDANLASVSQLLTAGGMLPGGLIGAFDPNSRSVTLRNNFSPLIPELGDLLLGQLGVPSLCLPVLATCGVSAEASIDATPARLTGGASPIASLLHLMGAPTVAAQGPGSGLLGSIGHHLQDAAETLVGVGS